MSLLGGMSLLSSAKKTGQLYLRNSKYFLYYYHFLISTANLIRLLFLNIKRVAA